MQLVVDIIRRELTRPFGCLIEPWHGQGGLAKSGTAAKTRVRGLFEPSFGLIGEAEKKWCQKES